MFDFFRKILTSSSNNKYDFETLEGIQNIPIPKYKPLQGMASAVNNIEYILQSLGAKRPKLLR